MISVHMGLTTAVTSSRCETVLSLGLADVLGRLRVIEREFAKWGSATYMHTDCRITARKAILDKMKQI